VPHPGGVELIRVLLVDDQPLVRAGLVRILEPEPDLAIVGECADGDEVEAAVAACAPDVILMDVRMKRMDGAEATLRVRQAEDAPAVLILTTFEDDQTVATALAAGAAGFLLKDAPGEDLIRATRTVGSGGAWLDPAVAGPVLDAYRSTALPRAQSAAKLAELTDRERGVLTLIGRGASNSEIGSTLIISEGTVKTHIGHIFTKLELRDRAAAIVFAFDHGLVEPGAAGGGQTAV
jgi:DNA-binding NarL/FixJ family response regulator